jgi:hypothetical protein
MHKLDKLHTDDNIKLCSFNITNIYTNIPINETKQIISEVLNNNNTPKIKKQEIESLLTTIIKQDFLQFNDQLYKHYEVVAPTSAIKAQTFIQHLEHKLIKIFNKYKILYYHRYVDDMLIL